MTNSDGEAKRALSIAVNVRFLLPGDKLEGIGRFTFEVLRRVVANNPEHTFHFLFDRAFDERYIFGSNVVPHVLKPPARHPVLYLAWYEGAVAMWLRRNHPDVFLSTDGHTTLGTSIPRVTVMHDLAFEHSSGEVSRLQELYYRSFFKRFARASERLCAVSDATRQDLADLYGIDRERIQVIHNAADERFAPSEEAERLLTRQQFSNGNAYFLFVGAVQPRKNLVNLLKAFDQFKEADPAGTKLLVVGRNAWRTGATLSAYRAMTHGDSVRLLGRVSDEELAALYGAAVALAYVPHFEGFGIPVVEAQSCGCPVITSNSSSLPEVAGEAALFVDPRAVTEIAAALTKLSRDATLRESLSQAGRVNARRFSWDDSARLLWLEVLAAAETQKLAHDQAGARIVVVGKFVPWPLNSGDKRRTLGLARALTAVGQVTICAFSGEDEDDTGLREQGIRVVSTPLRRTAKSLLRGLLRARSISAARFWSADMAALVRREIRDADVVIVEHVQLASYLGRSRARVRVLDMHNIESSLTSRMAASGPLPRRAILRLEARALRRLEAKVGRFDAVAVVSHGDQTLLREITASEPVILVPNAWDGVSPLPPAANPVVSFVGLMSWAPNADAACWFVDNVWPLVEREVPDARLLIVGRRPTSSVLRLASLSIEVTGAVEDLVPYYKQTRVAVAPLRAGGGSRLKILEALAFGRPVVSTTVGVEGLEDLVGRGVVVADTPEDMAREIVKLLFEPAAAAELGRAGAAAVVAEHSWDAASRPLIDFVLKKLGPQR